MKLLLHICCGPCALMPLAVLREEGHALTGYFDNPNIQPLAEYMRRREGAIQAAEHAGIPLVFPERQQEYDAKAWCREALAAAYSEDRGEEKDTNESGGRCAFCWTSRLRRSAAKAKALGLSGFTSSLLYSRHQNHEGIRKAGERAGEEYGVRFVYRDFRPLWQQGIERSKALNIYRQQYCGCLFSEEERYTRAFRALENP